MKIFNNNLKNKIKTVGLQSKLGPVNRTKYLPAFAKEWKNIIYLFNKNNLRNSFVNSININKIIKSYFNLFFKDNNFLGDTDFINLRKRRTLLNRIFVSDADIKYTNNKAKITLYTVNPEKEGLKDDYLKINKKLTFKLFKSYTFLYKYSIKNIYNYLNSSKYEMYNEYFFTRDFIEKRKFINYKLKYLNTFFKLNHLASIKMWNTLIKDQSLQYFLFLRKCDLLYSLNQFKFNKQRLLSKLTYLLEKIIGKKIEYNIVNLKSIDYHSDIMTDALALKIQKDRASPNRRMSNILYKAPIARLNKFKDKTSLRIEAKRDLILNRYRDLKIVSLLKGENLSTLLDNVTYLNRHRNNLPRRLRRIKANIIFDSISFKKITGIKLEVSGRLTKRYRADRSTQSLKWIGGLKNFDSSYKQLRTIYFRGNTKTNVSYSISKSKRRIGSFAVKGWIGAK